MCAQAIAKAKYLTGALRTVTSPPLGHLAMMLFLFVGLTGPLSAAPMRFSLDGNGGNCVGCEWISAEGEITAGSADDLSAFLRRERLLDWRGIVYLHSPGGSLAVWMRDLLGGRDHEEGFGQDARIRGRLVVRAGQLWVGFHPLSHRLVR